MQRVAFIYNPASGQHSEKRVAHVGKVLTLIRQQGIAVDAFETDAPGSARKLTREAIENGYDTILAGGGDGTVHEILQGIVGTSVALGVIPMGTANALAQDLGIARSPSRAVRSLLQAIPTPVPVGMISCHDRAGNLTSRYFTVAAGVGADALLMSRLDAGLKRKFGYILYLLEAIRIWATDPFPLFEAAFHLNGNAEPRRERVSQLLAVRVRSFGGVLGTLAPGATLHNGWLHLVAFKTRSRIRYLRFLLAVIAARQTFSTEVELLEATTVECRAEAGSPAPVYVEADGEVLGTLPARFEVASQRFTLLIPPHARP
ncbi:MAG TPA: diacylglycerol kinase family protein [Terracidiphilus sp.]|nr:diacylglycerol kinase family protein [Terracidiphilus sp.]